MEQSITIKTDENRDFDLGTICTVEFDVSNPYDQHPSLIGKSYNNERAARSRLLIQDPVIANISRLRDAHKRAECFESDEILSENPLEKFKRKVIKSDLN